MFLYEKIYERQQKIVDYTARARYYKLEKLPESRASIVVGNKALVVTKDSNKLQAYLFVRGLWRKKAECDLPMLCSVSGDGQVIDIVLQDRTEHIAVACDTVENETYFTRDVTYFETGDALFRSSYFNEGPIADFTYISLKWICRKQNPGPYPFDKSWSEYLGRAANNRIFYTCSGHMYFACAYMETEYDRISDTERDDTELAHVFRLREPLAGKHTFRFLWFFGEGGEEYMGHISNVLWRLDKSPIHSPQTDMIDFVDKYTSRWFKAALNGNGEADHYSAHYFTEFFGQFKNGYRPPDQFGCSWLEYDLLKAREFYRRSVDNHSPEDREHAIRIINFYLYDHFANPDTKLTFPFHTGAFMHDIMPFCERTGWGAPFEADALASLALPEMIFDAMVLYEMDKSLFKTDYPNDIAEDVLKLQQEDGHFRRLYYSNLAPKEKAGWISQYSETQTWIPALIKMYNATGNEKLRAAYIKCAERCLRDMDELGLFSMGGCETDYPDFWDVDGFRTMLWAFLDMYDQEKDAKWLEAAERTVLHSVCMQMGYDVPNLPDTFYSSIDWKSRGMIATSYYTWPDYSRTQCTATGNQSVVWVGYLLLRLYRATGKQIYAERGIATFRQVMLFRDEKSLEGNPHKDEILYSIYENNPQLDDESGLYKKSYAESSYTLYLDLYLYLRNIIQEFGGLYVDVQKQHAFALDCMKIIAVDWNEHCITVRNMLDHEYSSVLCISGTQFIQFTLPVNQELKLKF